MEDKPKGYIVPCLRTVDPEHLRELLAKDQFFWLDLAAPTPDDIERLGEIFHFHPLALEDTTNFGQRPKLDDYQDYMFVVFYGARETADDPDLLHEVHLFVSGSYLVTVHRDPIPPLEEQVAKIDGQPVHSEQYVLYLSTVSNRQNEVMKQLAIVGTIFLPLSFITGFFGMNFGWLVNHAITPTWTFWVLGMGSMLAACAGLFALFKRRGWL